MLEELEWNLNERISKQNKNEEVKKHSQMLETEASENKRMKEKLDIDNQIEKLYLSEWYIRMFKFWKKKMGERRI